MHRSMKLKLNYLLTILILISLVCYPQKKFLFDNTKAETAGNADWVIDEDNNVAGRYPSPDQSTVTSSTSESYWTGALSSWGIALVKLGHHVETLTSGSTITYGTTNTQDLQYYDVFVVDEPNTKFSTSEKTALINFVQNGGGLFMISDHTVSDRNNDGWDSPMIWNDLFTANGIVSNPFGMSVDLTNISQTSTNVLTGDFLTSGPAGTVTAMKWNNGATITINPLLDSTVTGVVWTSGTTHGNTNLMVARAKYGKGRIVLVADSSPADDGSGASGNSLFNGWLDPAVNGSHAALHLNGSLWLAKVLEPPVINGVNNNNNSPLPKEFNLLQNYPNPFNPNTVISYSLPRASNVKLSVFNIIGQPVRVLENGFKNAGSYNISFNAGDLSSGIYFYKLETRQLSQIRKMVLLK
jgi:hypothetical protein